LPGLPTFPANFVCQPGWQCVGNLVGTQRKTGINRFGTENPRYNQNLASRSSSIMTRKKLPIGIQTFAKIREDNHYYVDKTP
jgi:hypothetical protein